MDTMCDTWSRFFRRADIKTKVDVAVPSSKTCLHTEQLHPHCNLIQSAGTGGTYIERENELQS
ncbi:hypothetical protein JOB18_042645 [Solea senegalensis]|uniref:Uncharacterized protein n=1 Tax=Solea senegalensis TaxID=28829 RepID=A0AAV6QE75_SOLSE|nr:hypothetical protein JOB18_042645 [Solea senegalensis]